MAKVVITGKIPAIAVERLRAEHEVISWDEPVAISRDELLKRVKGADAIVSLLTEKVDAELLDAAGPQLKVVSNVAVGYNNIDVAAATRRGIVVTNTPDVLTDATADLTWALILAVARRVVETGVAAAASGRSSSSPRRPASSASRSASRRSVRPIPTKPSA